MSLKASKTVGSDHAQETGPWEPALAQLTAWDPAWAHICVKMTTNPWTSGVLPRKLVELIGVMLNAACTHLNPEGVRRHIRAALEAGATREEILWILKSAALAAIHSCMEQNRWRVTGTYRLRFATRCEPGQWNSAWDPFFELDPVWTDQFFESAVYIYQDGVFSAKDVELLSIAFDASFTHMYAPGTRRHIKGALKAGATMEEIMEVLKLCVLQGVQACNLGIPILAEEVQRAQLTKA